MSKKIKVYDGSLKPTMPKKFPNTEFFLLCIFSIFTVNVDIYSLNLHIQSAFRKILTRNNSIFDTFQTMQTNDNTLTEEHLGQ